MTVATAKKIKTISALPAKGKRFLSVNLSMVDVGDLWQVARGMGLSPELVQLSFSADLTEIHALLWQGTIEETPANLEQIFDDLCEQFPADAIWYPAGAWITA